MLSDGCLIPHNTTMMIAPAATAAAAAAALGLVLSFEGVWDGDFLLQAVCVRACVLFDHKNQKKKKKPKRKEEKEKKPNAVSNQVELEGPSMLFRR
jgi:hypothetical protein